MKYRLICADVTDGLRSLPDESVQCVVTSPPYWGLRDYGTATWQGGDDACDHGAAAARKPDERRASTLEGGVATIAAQDAGARARHECGKCGAKRVDDQLGLEPTPEEYIEKMTAVFREVRRVLRGDGTLWLNIGDSYNNAGSSRNGEGLDGSMRGGATGPEGALGYKRRDRRHSLGNIKHKDLVGIPWMLALALRADGWYLRSDIIWHKPNPMPESVTDRPTKSHEYLFLLTKSARYYYDAEAIAEPSVTGGGIQSWWRPSRGQENGRANDSGNENNPDFTETAPMVRNKRSVWTIATEPFPEAHFATFPTALVEPCILAGTSPKCCGECGAPQERIVEREVQPEAYEDRKGWKPTCDHQNDGGVCVVLDPFNGSGTTGVVAIGHQRDYLGIDLSAEYIEMARRRIGNVAPMFAKDVSV